jgi:hypothetical protein
MQPAIGEAGIENHRGRTLAGAHQVHTQALDFNELSRRRVEVSVQHAADELIERAGAGEQNEEAGQISRPTRLAATPVRENQV